MAASIPSLCAPFSHSIASSRILCSGPIERDCDLDHFQVATFSTLNALINAFEVRNVQPLSSKGRVVHLREAWSKRSTARVGCCSTKRNVLHLQTILVRYAGPPLPLPLPRPLVPPPLCPRPPLWPLDACPLCRGPCGAPLVHLSLSSLGSFHLSSKLLPSDIRVSPLCAASVLTSSCTNSCMPKPSSLPCSYMPRFNASPLGLYEALISTAPLSERVELWDRSGSGCGSLIPWNVRLCIVPSSPA